LKRCPFLQPLPKFKKMTLKHVFLKLGEGPRNVQAAIRMFM
jgi:hypothetical protein